MLKTTNKSEIQSWFEKTDLEGSILLRFEIDREQGKVVLITSSPMGSWRDYNFKFRFTEFGSVHNVDRSKPVLMLRPYAEDYRSDVVRGTVELERFQIKTYPKHFAATLDFGHNYGASEFEFNWIRKDLKLGKLTDRKRERIIIDRESNREIDFDNPFKPAQIQ